MPNLTALRSTTSTLSVGEDSSAPIVTRPKKKVLETPLGPREHLPRSRTTSTGTKLGVGSTVLLGLQATTSLLGMSSTANAQPISAQDFQARLAELEANKGSMSPQELAAARRALYTAYTALSQNTASTFPFEGEWAKAQPGSIDRAMVSSALKEMGKNGTEAKLLSLVEAHDARLSPEAKQDLATAAAARAMEADAVEGGLNKEELAQIEARLAAKLGPEIATKAVLRAFPTQVDALDDGAIEHLLTRAGSVESHAKRLISIVDERLEGKNVLVDVNGDGQIDKGDVVLSKKDDGKLLVERVSQKMADETKVGAAMVNASEKMHSSGVSFQVIKNHKANPDYWTIGAGGVLELKPGVKPSEALADITKNGGKYGFECATGLVVVYYQAMLELLGPQDFDRVASDLRMGPWVMEDDLDRLMTNRSPNPGAGVETPLGDKKLTPGEYYYFRNWDVTDEARERGWQGENVIYLGEGKFYGHGIGLGPGADFVNKLAGEMKPGGRTPSLLNINSYLSTDVLKLDLAPGK